MTLIEMNGRRPVGDDLPIALDFDGDETGGAHACTYHPAPSTVRDCIKCGATIFPHSYVQCSEGHFMLAFPGADGTMWCHGCEAFADVEPW